MMNSIMDRLSYAFLNNPSIFIYLFLGITFIIILSFELWQHKHNQIYKQINNRLDLTEEEKEEKKVDLTRSFAKFYEKEEKKILLILQRANIDLSAKEYFTIMVIGTFGGAVVGGVIFPLDNIFRGMFDFIPTLGLQDFAGRAFVATILGVAGYYFPRIIVFRKVQARRKDMNRQISTALLNIADGLNSGMVLNKAIANVGYEMPSPLGPEFEKTALEIESGKTITQALEDMKARINLEDFTLAVNAMQIQEEMGGELEPLLRNIEKVIEERQELKQEIKKTISGSKTVGIILLMAPIGFAVLFGFMNTDQYIEMWESFFGKVMFFAAVTFYLIAAGLIFYIIHSITKEA